MAGNFRRVLIFIIFVVGLAVTKFSHPRKLMPTVIWYHDDGRGHRYRDSAANTFQCVQATVATVIQLIASSTLIFFYLMPFVPVSVGMA